MNKTILSLVIIFYTSCATKPLLFRQVFPYRLSGDSISQTALINGKTVSTYEFYFIVSNYKDHRENEKKIDSFANKVFDNNIFSFNTKVIWISIYKETNKTNPEAVQRWPRIIGNYSDDNDLIYNYKYDLSGLKYKAKIEKGKVVNQDNGYRPPNFNIEPLPNKIK